jgi:uncharacterized protein with HEPN domain
MKKDRVYLDHILECIGWIERFTAEGCEAFLKDRKTQSAVLRELQTLAESTERLSEEFKSRHPQIPWRNIAGFRNILVHDYLGIKLQRIWEIIEADLRLLKATLNQAIGEKKNKKI